MLLSLEVGKSSIKDCSVQLHKYKLKPNDQAYSPKLYMYVSSWLEDENLIIVYIMVVLQ